MSNIYHSLLLLFYLIPPHVHLISLPTPFYPNGDLVPLDSSNPLSLRVASFSRLTCFNLLPPQLRPPSVLSPRDPTFPLLPLAWRQHLPQGSFVLLLKPSALLHHTFVIHMGKDFSFSAPSTPATSRSPTSRPSSRAHRYLLYLRSFVAFIPRQPPLGEASPLPSPLA